MSASSGKIHGDLRQEMSLGLAVMTLLLYCGASPSASAQQPDKNPTALTEKKPALIKEELILKNGDRLTGQLLNSTGAKIKFKSELTGVITVPWDSIQQLNSLDTFAVIPKSTKKISDRSKVAEGFLQIREGGVNVVSQAPVPKEPKDGAAQAGDKRASSAAGGVPRKEIESSQVGFLVDDKTYQKETQRKIGFTSGWTGHVTTGTSVIRATQNSYLFEVDTALKRKVPTVTWLDPKLRTTLNFTLSAGKTTQPGDPDTVTNIFHVDAERDEYMTRQVYLLQATSFDHNFSQGLVLQQTYGGGVGAAFFKTVAAEFDLTADLHYESQRFNKTANVPELNLNLIGSTLTEAYTHKWDKLTFEEKLSLDPAWNNFNAFSASGTTSIRLPLYKILGFSVATIDTFLNNPQVGYRKNSFQLTTGFTLSLP